MEFETYGDVIDAFERDNMGYDTLTDYIKGENIKIAEIDMDPIGDFAKIFNKKDGGMMIAIEQLGKGGITGGKTYHQYHDQFVPPDSESEMYANGGGVGSMMKPKKKNFKMQGGVRNYLGNQKQVKAPLKWQSSPDHPTTELAYITKKEKDLLVKSDLHGSLKNGVNRGPSGIMSLNGYGSFDDPSDPGRDTGMSGAATSAAESGGGSGADRRELDSYIDYGSDTQLPPGVDRKLPQDIQDYRNAFIAAGGGQRVNPGFFDSRNVVSPEELARARAFARDRQNRFARDAMRRTRGGGLMNFVTGGGFLGNILRGIGRRFGLGKDFDEPTYDMSEFNRLGLGGVDPFANVDIRDIYDRRKTNVTNEKPPANIKGTNLNDFEIGNPGKYATADMINEFGVKAGTADDIGFIGMPGTADDRFANMYEDPFGNPTNDPRVVSEEMGLVGNQVPQGIRFNNPVGGVDQFAKEMEALEASLPMGVNAIMTPEMMGGTLQDFYTNRNLTGASTGGIPSNAKSMFEVFNDNVNFNDQVSLPGNNMVAEITQKDIDRFKQPMTQMMDYDTYKSINTDSTLTPDEFNQLKAQV